MKTFTRDYRITPYEGEIFSQYFGEMKPCVFDIETTGLSATRGNKVILTALMTPYKDGMRITQYLAEDPFEEDRVLMATLKFLEEEGVDYLITFNGDAFDVPFFNKRLEETHIGGKLPYYSLDLYRFLRKHSILPKVLDRMNQKSVEKHFGIGTDRNDVITGRESVKLYKDYVLKQDTVIEKIILTHNREDVLQLMKVMKAAGQDNFREILKVNDGLEHATDDSFDQWLDDALDMVADDAVNASAASQLERALARTGLPSAGGDLTATPKIANSCLTISGEQLRAPRQEAATSSVSIYDMDDDKDESPAFPYTAILYPDWMPNAHVEFSAATSSYRIRIPLIKEGSSMYLDCQPLMQTVRSTEDEALQLWMQKLQSSSAYINDYLLLVEEGVTNQNAVNQLSVLISSLSWHLITR